VIEEQKQQMKVIFFITVYYRYWEMFIIWDWHGN
jgi:hypothetical protein